MSVKLNASECDIIVRKAVPEDVDSVCELLFGLKSIYASCTEKGVSEFSANYRLAVTKALDISTISIWVAQDNGGGIIGYCSTTRRHVLRLAGTVGVLEEIYVVPKHRRQRVALRLWNCVIEEMRAFDVKQIEVVSSLAHPGQRQFARAIHLQWYSSIHNVTL